jgi:hypothetical protein
VYLVIQSSIHFRFWESFEEQQINKLVLIMLPGGDSSAEKSRIHMAIPGNQPRHPPLASNYLPFAGQDNLQRPWS